MILTKAVDTPEGPVLLADGGWAFVEMNKGLISRVNPNGKEKTVLAKTGRPNGMALDGDGNLWIAEAGVPSLLRLSRSGELSTISTGSKETPFLWPNDLCFGSDCMIYMTDSGILVEDLVKISPPSGIHQAGIDGRLFRVDPVTGNAYLLDDNLGFTNGVAFAPGGEDLFLNDTLTGNVYKYKIRKGELNQSRTLFANVMINPTITYDRMTGPDGMAFDRSGNLYVTVYREKNVTVLDPNGKVIQRIDLDGLQPTNIAFGPAGINRALVTDCEKGQLELVDTIDEGLALYAPTFGFYEEMNENE